MSMKRRYWAQAWLSVVVIVGAGLIGLAGFIPSASAVSPGAIDQASVQQGRQLFERNWTPENPNLGGDGLGPLFNGQSCVACHRMKGVGGGGESEFNALTIGIEHLEIDGGQIDAQVIARMVRSFHPGLVGRDGIPVNTFTIPHRGGSDTLRAIRRTLLNQIGAEFSPEGGPTSAEEMRLTAATPIVYRNRIGPHTITLTARLFGRNTTALYGAGLIDQIPARQIQRQAKLQQRHPEISGRVSTLRDGRIGRFGWRANVATLLEFNDQACANEIGLETRRKPQADDPTRPEYKNAAADVTDDQIRLINAFVAALPAPMQRVPEDTQTRMKIERGKRVFANVGCAVCHVPDLGPAVGMYSDLLLHDMGYELMDLNAAEPYIIRVSPESDYRVSGTRRVTGMTSGYYGRSTSMTVPVDTVSSIGGRSGRLRSRSLRPATLRRYVFRAPTTPIPFDVIPVRERRQRMQSERETTNVDGLTGQLTVREDAIVTRTDYLNLRHEMTKINQEWRTPPLWGVADSAPYMHDGRAGTLLEAIAIHEGEAAGVRDRFLDLSIDDRRAVIAFLKSLVAPAQVPQPQS